MKITVHSSKAVKPAYDGVPPATAAVPLTVFDKANFDTYISLIHAFRPPAPPNAALEAGLAKVLAVCRERAGRLGVDARGNRTILLTDEGARFVEATADVALDSVMPLEPTAELLSLHPMVSGDGAAELLLVQVTRFACGSLVVGSTMQHIIGDGGGTSNFFMAWGQATRGVALDPAPVPVHARASMFAPRDPPRVEFEHRGVEFKPASSSCEKKIVCDDDDDEVVVQRVHLSREFIAELKSAASAGAPRPYSTLVCVVAHLWRCITAARGLDEARRTSLRVAVDGRARMSPRVPDGYTGNVVLWARPTARAGDLVVAPLWHAAALIHREVARMDDAYFKSFVDFASSGAVEEEGLVAAADAAEMVLSPDVEVDSCLRLPFCYDLDFGGGRPFFFMTSYMPVEGVLMLVRSFDGDGGVDAYVPLFSRHMDTFNNCCYSTGPSSKTYNWPRAKF